MAIKLPNGRNNLDRFIEINTPLESLLIKGRLLESDFHDAEGCRGDHMHWYKKVLTDYDPETDSVLLSKKGSRRLLKKLDEPDRKYSSEELYRESLEMNWKIREKDSKIY